MSDRSESLRRRLLTLACELLAAAGDPVTSVIVTVTTTEGDREYVLRSRPGDIVTHPATDPTLSPLDRAILAACGRDPLPAKKLAAKMGRSCNGHLREHLRTLVRRSLLSQGPDGYMLPMG